MAPTFQSPFQQSLCKTTTKTKKQFLQWTLQPPGSSRKLTVFPQQAEFPLDRWQNNPVVGDSNWQCCKVE